MNLVPIYTAISAGKDHVLKRLTKDLQSHRSVWNYVYMLLYVVLVVYLAIKHGAECGNAIVLTTGGVVTGIFTNAVWSKTVEKIKGTKNDIPSGKPKVDDGEVGAGD